ncbi:hypothetical protein SCHPADRAFT_940706 [Schizopora paradoxa]|uniref:Uncharacterized protein n=1 Tax=Schizopora paradoxa TaxID=27342 RepID=A0A0H2RN66_9AGAM|nr:hypothetical protein SCHPADRAFT_940706 [Schizopora paradoxa]
MSDSIRDVTKPSNQNSEPVRASPDSLRPLDASQTLCPCPSPRPQTLCPCPDPRRLHSRHNPHDRPTERPLPSAYPFPTPHWLRLGFVAHLMPLAEGARTFPKGDPNHEASGHSSRPHGLPQASPDGSPRVRPGTHTRRAPHTSAGNSCSILASLPHLAPCLGAEPLPLVEGGLATIHAPR